MEVLFQGCHYPDAPWMESLPEFTINDKNRPRVGKYRCSMYGICTYMWPKCIVDVLYILQSHGAYGIHGSYGLWFTLVHESHQSIGKCPRSRCSWIPSTQRGCAVRAFVWRDFLKRYALKKKNDYKKSGRWISTWMDPWVRDRFTIVSKLVGL